ncbi:alpha-amylase family glycosyl hydrolase [Flavobacterium saccharophilum]|uniref:Por secretion system C-terminal sorting domain-containing protein n=1 Tax=Flavobacterium saccharophilum TaxID=29534 RepID=A0A1M7AZ00_9FLAO|nr:alpha-amylase family glycosyl hydrolase [Flavobacterium saccharophilum]SHL47944.1 Por secretion system C-terminal sorting domain-containing protein [Flavobacterium saccharophilum]
MKKTLLLFFFLLSIVANSQQITVSPAVFQVNEPITITASFTSSTCNTMGSSPAKVYMHSGIGTEANPWQTTKGNWGLDDGVGVMTKNGNGTWSITITPSVYFGLSSAQQTAATKMGLVFRNANGSQTLKLAPSCTDFFLNVGSFQVTLTAPAEDSNTIVSSGGSFNISATNTNGVATYTLKSNGTIINTSAGVSSYTFNHTNIIDNQSYELNVTQGATTVTKKFNVIVNPNTVSEAMPSGLVDGINYNATDATKATLVLDAPLKDFVYVAGSFNNWQPSSAYAMKKDPTSGKFWLELTGLVSGENNTYQYWVVDATPLANSPSMVKTADPYSTLVLSPYDDAGIPAASYPNIPVYPAGQNFEVTVLKTGQTPYNWQVTNFTKPEKDKLVVYEVLVRDFDAARNYQSLIDKIEYFKTLKINAIELMPVMEFEGNESWGYNTSFHMALDKFYGTSDKLKELIDLCHQNGIAVILDVALNHAFGRNPMVRMWMNDADGDGFGSPTAENPYFNTVAKHSYSVGEDFNHQSLKTQYYVERVVKQWIEEYKIDGFRWDLTKGFTQVCTAADEACTNRYQQDRVDILKKYADYSWSLDPTHYTIFEHLGSDAEEQEWANYKIAETPSKGIMMWGKMTDQYNQLSMGYPTENNISRMMSSSRGFTANRLMGYAESHDEERLMYKNVQYGNSSGTYNVKTLNTALSRMSAIGAVSLLIPGPKMIWHFGELGWDESIFTCKDGSVNDASGTLSGDCKLDTKPQPQWAENWLGNTNRNKIYYDWAKMINLKVTEPVFLGTATMANANTLTVNVKITNSNLAVTQLKDVLILANFDVTAKNVATGFQYTGTWYNLMDNTSMNVTDVNATINLAPGEYRIYGNKTANLAIPEFEKENSVNLYPNPVLNHFTLNIAPTKVHVYAISGQLVKSFSPNGNTDFQYGVSELKTGLYVVKAIDENNKVQVMKFIKK